MQDSQLISEGLSLMAFGMGFVFVFLSVLVIITTLMSRTLGHVFLEPVAAPISASHREGDDLRVVITAALHRYHKRHGQQRPPQPR